jgi:hypothetical protein
MSVKLNRLSYEHAHKLIKHRQFAVDDHDQCSITVRPFALDRDTRDIVLYIVDSR